MLHLSVYQSIENENFWRKHKESYICNHAVACSSIVHA